MSTLIVHARFNSEGMSDATGAFVPEARGFAKHYADRGPVVCSGFDNMRPPTQRARDVETLIAAAAPAHQIALLVVLCHGLRSSLQTGHRLQTVARLARAIRAVCTDDVRVALMACSTAATPTRAPDGEGGLADALRDELVLLGCRGGHVDGHTNAGHCTRNRFVRRMRMEPGEQGGDWIVEPQTHLWGRWGRALQGTLRFRFPIMTLEQIRAEVESIV
jgi:hypothetical protein